LLRIWIIGFCGLRCIRRIGRLCTRRVGVALCRGTRVDVLIGYDVNVKVAIGVPTKAVSDGVGDCEEVMVGIGVNVIEGVGGEVGVEWGVWVATGKVIVPFGVTVATGVCR
jgi:hypothetical protein